ncbi:MAG: cysteine desulfurase family protein [Bacteroidota bacterium]
MMAYLDNAATTQLDPKVMEAMIEVMKSNYGNPSSIHGLGRQARSVIERARKTVAKIINASPGEIFFTSGGTEADNTAIIKTIEDHKITHAISTEIEHHAVSHTLEYLEKAGKINYSKLSLTSKGEIDLAELEMLLKENPNSFVSLMHANNEIGNLLPIDEVGELCKKYNAIFHSDTVQTVGHLPIDVRKSNVNFIACAAHKFHGPKGVGFLFIDSNLKINPFVHGGAQERNMRGGTENIYGIAGLAKALEIADAEMMEHKAHIESLKMLMIEQLKSRIAGVEFNGLSSEISKSLYTVLSVHLPPTPTAEMLLFNLDINGIFASGGSACSSGSNQGSHVLRALNIDQSRPSVRFSFSKFTTKEEVILAVDKLCVILGI